MVYRGYIYTVYLLSPPDPEVKEGSGLAVIG